MQRKLILLNPPQRRAFDEGLVWFADGWQMLKAAPGLWAGASLAALAVYIAAAAAASIFSVIPYLHFLPQAAANLIINMGMISLMQEVAEGRMPKSKHFFAFWAQHKRPAFWQLTALLFFVQTAIALWLHPPLSENFYSLDGERLMLKPELLRPYLSFIITALFASVLLSWAMPALLTDFPNAGFAALMRTQWQALNRNIIPLSVLAMLAAASISVFILMVGMIAVLSQTLGLSLLMLGILWLWPLLAAWSFSAVRHTCTDW